MFGFQANLKDPNFLNFILTHILFIFEMKKMFLLKINEIFATALFFYEYTKMINSNIILSKKVYMTIYFYKLGFRYRYNFIIAKRLTKKGILKDIC